MADEQRRERSAEAVLAAKAAEAEGLKALEGICRALGA
jgi:hypothetical protein